MLAVMVVCWYCCVGLSRVVLQLKLVGCSIGDGDGNAELGIDVLVLVFDYARNNFDLKIFMHTMLLVHECMMENIAGKGGCVVMLCWSCLVE
jgi:hypothetical protein